MLSVRLRSRVLLVKQSDEQFCACAMQRSKVQRTQPWLSGCLETAFVQRACASNLDATGGGARGGEKWGGGKRLQKPKP